MSEPLPRVRRIKKITLDNFRGFSQETPICTDGDIVLITGKNGVGKSSILYALDCFLHGYNTDESILGDYSIGEMVGRTKEKAASIKVDYYPLNDVSNNIQIDELQMSAKGNTPEVWDKKASLRQERASAVYQDLIGNPQINDIIKDFLFQDQFDFGKKLPTVISSITQRLKDNYLKYDGYNPVEKRKSYLDKLNYILNGIRGAYPQFSVVINGLEANYFSDITKVQESLNTFSKNMGKEVSDNDLDNEVDSIKGSLIRIKKVFGELASKELSRREKIKENNNENPLIGFLKIRISDTREIKKFEKGVNIENIKVGTIFLISTIEEFENLEKVNLQVSNEIRKYEDSIKAINETLQMIESAESESGAFDSVMRSIQNFNQVNEKVEKSLYPLPKTISEWLKNQSKLCNSMQKEYTEWRNKIEQSINQEKSKMNYYEQIKRNLEESLELGNRLGNFTIEEFERHNISNYGDFAKVIINEKASREESESNNFNIMRSINDLINNIDQWINTEEEIEQVTKDKLSGESDEIKAKEILNALSRMGTREKGKNSILAKNVLSFQENELEQLSKMMNSMLRLFHFPLNFLPIMIESRGRRNNPEYIFVTNKKETNVDFGSLSTGQKVQLYLCWTISLNYALQELRTHDIMLFDDITTSLDMSQLLPAATFLRQIAYSENEKQRRQVFITCHHEDFTNKLLDYLMPPPGRKLKVVRFLEWKPGTVPKIEYYDVKDNSEKNLNDKKKEFFALMERRNSI